MGDVLPWFFIIQAFVITAYDGQLRRRDGESGWQALNPTRRRVEWGLDLAFVATLLLCALTFRSRWWTVGEPVPVAIAWWWVVEGRRAAGRGRHAVVSPPQPE